MSAITVQQKLMLDYWIAQLSFMPKDSLEEHAAGKPYQHSVRVSNESLAYVHNLTQGNELSALVIYQSVYYILLKKYYPQNDALIVSPGMPNKEERYPWDGLLFLPIRTDDNCHVKQTIRKTKDLAIDAFKYGNYALNDLEALMAARGASLAPYMKYGLAYGSADRLPETFEKVRFRMLLNPVADGLNITVESDEAMENADTAINFLRHFAFLIKEMERIMDTPLRQVNIMPQEERELLLTAFNATAKPFPTDKTIVDIVEAQVSNTPGNIAVMYKREPYTYDAINKRANQLARYLLANRLAGPGSIVAVLIPKSIDTVIAILAVLKAGAVYLPIAEENPAARIQYIIEDSCPSVLLTVKQMAVPDVGWQHVTVCIDELNLRGVADDNLAMPISPNDLAYVIYTSGSTGLPKGVMIRHTSNVNMSLDQINIFSVSERDRVLLFASLSFDASVSEMFMALYCGATLVVPEGEELREKDLLLKCIKSNNVTVITLPPSYLMLFNEEEIETSGLRCIITAGEPAHVAKAVECARHVDYFNAYGPTECAVCVSAYQVTEKNKDNRSIPIGRPIANLSVYILDESLMPVPAGLLGKIYVAGVGLAVGYLNKSALTAQVFIDNPFIPGERMYDTGDWGRWLPDGNIEYFGRSDRQVKIRGHRVETGEVENALLQQKDLVIQAAVDVRQVKGEKCLVAYICPMGVLNKALLKQRLSHHLPGYMIPAYFTTVDELPLTTNGKVDRKKLLDITLDEDPERSVVEASTELERSLVEIWKKVLGINNVGVTDDFFQLGGHSLKIAQVLSEIKQTLGMELRFKSFMKDPTIRGISIALNNTGQPVRLGIERVKDAPYYDLSPGQKRLWLLSQYNNGSAAYNMGGAYDIKGNIDKAAFQRAFDTIIERHEILRTVLVMVNGIPRQKVLQPSELGFRVFHEALSGGLQPALVEEMLNNESRTPFDLEVGPLIRCRLIDLGPSHSLMLLTLHHTIGDGQSMGVLFSELFQLYEAFANGEKNMLPPLPFQYRDYACWHLQALNATEMNASAAFWRDYLSGRLPRLCLPSDTGATSADKADFDGSMLHFSNDPMVLRSLIELAQKEKSTLFSLMAACCVMTLFKFSSQRELMLGIPLAGRMAPGMDKQIGFYLNMVPLRIKFNPRKPAGELIKNFLDEYGKVYDHQDYPLDEIADELGIGAPERQAGLFDVVINYIPKNHMFPPCNGRLNVSPLPYHAVTSKFNVEFTFYEGLHGELCIQLNYKTSLLTAESARLMGAILSGCLQALPAGSDAGVMKMLYSVEEKLGIANSEIDLV
jgi:amino acid adenylation domain-containing protein